MNEVIAHIPGDLRPAKSPIPRLAERDHKGAHRSSQALADLQARLDQLVPGLGLVDQPEVRMAHGVAADGGSLSRQLPQLVPAEEHVPEAMAAPRRPVAHREDGPGDLELGEDGGREGPHAAQGVVEGDRQLAGLALPAGDPLGGDESIAGPQRDLEVPTEAGGRHVVVAPTRSADRVVAEDSAGGDGGAPVDRKSTRLNSSHSQISYAV